MTADVVSLDDHRPQASITGTLRCLACKHECEAVAPAGTPEPIECPSCGLERAYWFAPILADVGRQRYVCACGGEVFSIHRPSETAKRQSGRAGRDEGWLVCVGCGGTASLVAVWA